MHVNHMLEIEIKLFAVILIAVGCMAGCKANTGTSRPAVNAVDVTQDGTYEQDGWKYVYDVKEIEGQTDGWWGYLYRDGNHLGDLPNLPVGRKMQTPWGAMYWVGVPQMVTGYHGWLPLALAQDAWSSRQKPKHWENVEDFQQNIGQVSSEGAPSDEPSM